MRCPLCPNRAGAMKPSVLSVKTDLFEKANPKFHRYLISFANSLDLSKSKSKSTIRSKRDEELTKVKHTGTDLQKVSLGQENEEENDEETNENLYYDYHQLSKISNECPLEDEPKPVLVWIHITCATYISELYFQDECSLTEINGNK